MQKSIVKKLDLDEIASELLIVHQRLSATLAPYVETVASIEGKTTFTEGRKTTLRDARSNAKTAKYIVETILKKLEELQTEETNR